MFECFSVVWVVFACLFVGAVWPSILHNKWFHIQYLPLIPKTMGNTRFSRSHRRKYPTTMHKTESQLCIPLKCRRFNFEILFIRGQSATQKDQSWPVARQLRRTRDQEVDFGVSQATWAEWLNRFFCCCFSACHQVTDGEDRPVRSVQARDKLTSITVA